MAALAALMRSDVISPSFPVRPVAPPHQACPQEPADFLAVIRDTTVPPKPHVNHVDHVGGTRDWKGFFAALGLEVHGHTRTQRMKAAGVYASHCFRFVRRRKSGRPGGWPWPDPAVASLAGRCDSSGENAYVEHIAF